MELETKVKKNKLKWLTLVLFIVALIEGWIIFVQSKPENTVLLAPYFFSDSQWNGGYFNAHGSWISDTKLAIPVQTIELTCFKDFGYCITADAGLQDNFLSVGINLSTIETWDSEKIITKAEPSAAGCVTNRIEIDRATKRVISSRVTLDNKTGFCEGIEEKPIVSYLGDGLKRLDVIKNQKD